MFKTRCRQLQLSPEAFHCRITNHFATPVGHGGPDQAPIHFAKVVLDFVTGQKTSVRCRNPTGNP
jgi:glycine cleavage system protein P-like pyridoxal-binding family